MWAGVPVLSYISKKKDPSKDFVFKNSFGWFESNQILELTLANWTSIDVDVIEFNKHFQKSEKLPAKDHNWNPIMNDNLKYTKSFTFDVDGEIFTVLHNMIN
jgi:hypothetical protein